MRDVLCIQKINSVVVDHHCCSIPKTGTPTVFVSVCAQVCYRKGFVVYLTLFFLSSIYLFYFSVTPDIDNGQHTA